MLDPAAVMHPAPSSPTNSSISSSDLDTESTGSFFHDRSTTLGTLMGVTFPTIDFRAPSQHRDCHMTAATVSAARNKKKKAAVSFLAERRRWRRWWSLCKDGETKPASLGDFLEVERRYGDAALYGEAAAAEIEEGVMVEEQARNGMNGRMLFADGRVLPPPAAVAANGATTAGGHVRFPVLLTGICSSGV